MAIGKDSSAAEHWDGAYAAGDRERSWYQDHARTSTRLLQEVGSVSDSVIDVGAGASTLVDDLLAAGYTDVTLLDVSADGLEIARQRLSSQAESVTWIVDDLLTWKSTRTYDVWHDRAVLHFLTDRDEQLAYRRALLSATHPGSRVTIGVFGHEGPSACSGLDVQQYDAAELGRLLGDSFSVTSQFTEEHQTPSSAGQQFQWISALRGISG